MNRTPRRRPGLGWLLVALGAAAPALGQDAKDVKKELQAIEKELQQERKELRQAARVAEDDAAAEALYTEFNDKILPEFAARYARVARAHQGTDGALEAWMKVIELATQGLRGEHAAEALKVLTSDHLRSERLAALASHLRYGAPNLDERAVTAALRTIAEGSPHRQVQATALFSLGAVLGEDRPAGDARLEKAKEVFARLATYADLEYREGQSFAEAATAFVFALENLAVGKPCPDFAAVDAEGTAFKLSDYKGKVVLIDFWGFW